ncbi:MAG: hypothetical protein EOP06_21230 [Proteobacteria bacterium]|nr:MAG: hypothetical protein EOP06_21230 [Pseudomonadota bacterium]
MRFLSDTDALSKSESPIVAPGPGPFIPPVDPTPAPTPAATPAPTPVVVAPTPVVVAPTPTPTPVVVAPPATPTPTPTPVVVAPRPSPTPVVVAPAPTPVPQDSCQQAGISQKACYLMKVMELGCPLRDHTPANYKAPTRAQIIGNMDRCDERAYPTTVMTSSQWTLIQKLIDPNDASFRKLVFTKLYYKPDFTDDFAKYFGVELYNSIYTFCDSYGVPPGEGSILPGKGVNNTDYQMDEDYMNANVYAGQLNQCVTSSMGTP